MRATLKRGKDEMAKRLAKWALPMLFLMSTLFILFFLSPVPSVSAHFSETVKEDVGIKLTLGNLALSPENDETLTGLTYSGGDPVTLSTHNLKNKGTLNGKLAYQIQVTEKGTDTPVDVSGMQLIMSFDSVLGDKTIPASEINTSKYTFITDSEGKEWIFDANQKEDLPVTIKYKSTDIPEKEREIDITVTFLLVQTNASEPKETMFYDKVSFKHEVQLKTKAEEVPDPADPEYWPAADDENWEENGEVRYNKVHFEEIMYFSETESGEKVRNLNDNMLYIELPEETTKEDQNFRINSNVNGTHIEAKVMENKRHIKVTFSFYLTSEEAVNLLSQRESFTISFEYGKLNSSITFGTDFIPLVYKRILLSSDEKRDARFEIRRVDTTPEPRKITFKYVFDDWGINIGSWINQPLSDAKLQYKELEATVSKEPALFDLNVHKASKNDDKDYLLINTNKTVDTTNITKDGKLKIVITGNDGRKLVIYRELKVTKETNQAELSRTLNQSEIQPWIQPVETQTESEEKLAEETIPEKEVEADGKIEAEKDELLQDGLLEEEPDETTEVAKEIVAEEPFQPVESTTEQPEVEAGEKEHVEKEALVQEESPEQKTRILENQIAGSDPPQ